jgi:hypothetical protein
MINADSKTVSRIFPYAISFLVGYFINSSLTTRKKNNKRSNFGDLALTLPSRYCDLCVSCDVNVFDTNFNYIPVGDISSVLSKALTETFVTKIQNQITRKCKFVADALSFTFYCTPDDDEKLIEECVEMCLFVRNLSRSGAGIAYHVFLIDFPKVNDSSTIVASYDHINSGMCDGNAVYVWRKEEVLKVICHESVHAFKMDFHADSLYFVPLKRDLGWHVKGPFNPSESTTEAITRILICIYFANKNDDVWVQESLKDQFNHSIMSAAKILKMNNFHKMSDLTAKIWEQETYALEYYLLTAALLHESCDDDELSVSMFSKMSNNYKSPRIIYESLLRALHPGSNFCSVIDALLTYKEFDTSLKMNIFG